MEIIVEFPLAHIKMKKDFSKKIQLLHHVTIDGKIIWPRHRAGEVIKEADDDGQE